VDGQTYARTYVSMHRRTNIWDRLYLLSWLCQRVDLKINSYLFCSHRMMCVFVCWTHDRPLMLQPVGRACKQVSRNGGLLRWWSSRRRVEESFSPRSLLWDAVVQLAQSFLQSVHWPLAPSATRAIIIFISVQKHPPDVLLYVAYRCECNWQAPTRSK